MMLSLILGGAFGFLLLMFGFAGSASAATGDTLVSTPTQTTTISADTVAGSAEATVSGDGATVSADTVAGSAEATVSGDGATVSADTVAGSAEATVSGDGATVSADSPVGSADVTLGGDGGTVSVDSPVGSADLTVGGDGGTVSVDSPVGSADLTVGEDPNTSPGLDVSVAPAPSPDEAIAVDGGAQAEAPVLPIDLGRSRFTVSVDPSAGSLGQVIRGISTGDVLHPLRFPSYPANPIAPEGRAGIAPTPSFSEDHLPGGTWSWLILIVLFTSLWYLLTARSPMPHGVGAVLALPG